MMANERKIIKKKHSLGQICKRIALLGMLVILGIFLWKEFAANRLARKIPLQDEWNLVVVNEWNPLPENFDETLTLMELSNGQKIDIRVYPHLQEMFDAMRSENIYPTIREGYRNLEEQQEILDERILRYMDAGLSKWKAKKEALQYVALPGYSEHHMGSAVDINADISMSTNEDVYQWLAKHAYEYGFVLRYPYGKENITGIEYEPWHYRYVGKEAAYEMHVKELCLEEYVEAYK